MAKILIFGGSGIISTEIVQLTIQNGHDVTIVNRGRRKAFMHPQAKSIVADMQTETIDSLRQKIRGNFDTVIDFLAYTPKELRRNTELVKGRCSQYIFISSATVYNQKDGRFSEDDPIGVSEWSYAVNKAACERLLVESSKQMGFAYTAIRPYITYGKTRIPLQFAPIAYYTVIHRMCVGKCVPLFGENVACTLTSAKDFAVAAVGLIQNMDAYGEVYHITGSYETDWETVLAHVAAAFDCIPDIARLPESILRNRRLTRGLDVCEILADKGRNMLFNNVKICRAVPEFQGTTTFDKMLPEIVAYFTQTSEARRIDYAWDARMDRLLYKISTLNTEQKKKLKFMPCEKAGKREKWTYLINRNEVLYIAYNVIGKTAKLAMRCLAWMRQRCA